jgi:hypothetical protein
VTTNLELPNPDKPAVKAKGTVNPSDNPTILLISFTRLFSHSHLHIPDHLGRDQIPLILPF